MTDFIEKVRSDGDILAEYKHWYAILDIKQYYLGRLFLYAKREGATDMVEINQEERDELWEILRYIKDVVYPKTWKPDIINYAFLGNEVQHCHLHIIPRYKSDREITINEELFKDENYGHNYSNPNTKATRKRLPSTQAIIRNELKRVFMNEKHAGGHIWLRNNFFGLNKQEILDRHAKLELEPPKEAHGTDNKQDIMRATNRENQKGIGYSDIILGEELRGILADDNFIVAEIIFKWEDPQGKGLKSFQLTTDPDADEAFGLMNYPRVFVGNKEVIKNIIARSEQNIEQAEALINFAEEEYIADKVLESPRWMGLDRAEKIFHIIARYRFDTDHIRIIRLLFGDLNQPDNAAAAVDEDDEGEDEDDDEDDLEREAAARKLQRFYRGSRRWPRPWPQGAGRKTKRRRKKKRKKTNEFSIEQEVYSKIVNPETGKKIKLNSKKGKIILNKYLNLIGGSKCNKTNPKPPCKMGYEIGNKNRTKPGCCYKSKKKSTSKPHQQKKLNKIIYLDDKKNIYIILSGLRYESRDIIKVGLKTDDNNEYLQAFYRSSGSNTKQQGTFMPFDGIGLKFGKNDFSVFLEKNYVMNYLKEFNNLSNNKDQKILSSYDFFKRIGNCYLGLISFLLGGSAWNNKKYTPIFNDICIKKFKKKYIDYLLSPKTIETIQKNLKKCNNYFYDYKSKLKQSINLPEKNTPLKINEFVETSTTINNFNSLNLSEYEIQQLKDRNKWPIILPTYPYSSKYKGILYKHTIIKREILKDIPIDPKKKEARLNKIKERMNKMKKN